MAEAQSSIPQLRDFAGYAKPGTELGGIARILLGLIARILFVVGLLIVVVLLLLTLELHPIVSKIVIIQPDSSESIEWELSTVVALKQDHPEHLLFSTQG